MRYRLEYLGKEQRNGHRIYKFKFNGVYVEMDKWQAIEIVSSIGVKERNCKISRGDISFKAEVGNISNRGKKVVWNKYYGGIVNVCVGKEYMYSGECIKSNDIYFDRYTRVAESVFFKKYADIIYRIDKAKVIDYRLHSIQTPYGITDISNLSTGLKTILNILYMIDTYGDRCDMMISISECGGNVYSYLFNIVSSTGIRLWVGSISRAKNVDKYIFNINGKRLGRFIDVIKEFNGGN